MTTLAAPRFALSTRQFYWLLILPAAAMMFGFYLYPIAKVLWISVTEPRPGLENYQRLLDSESVQRVLALRAAAPTI